MTTIDDRPAVSAADKATSHLTMMRIIGTTLLDPTLPQPSGWDHTVWAWGPEITGYFHTDHATLAERREQVRVWAEKFGLTLQDEREQESGSVCVKARGEYEGVRIVIHGFAPAEDGAA